MCRGVSLRHKGERKPNDLERFLYEKDELLHMRFFIFLDERNDRCSLQAGFHSRWASRSAVRSSPLRLLWGDRHGTDGRERGFPTASAWHRSALVSPKHGSGLTGPHHDWPFASLPVIMVTGQGWGSVTWQDLVHDFSQFRYVLWSLHAYSTSCPWFRTSLTRQEVISIPVLRLWNHFLSVLWSSVIPLRYARLVLLVRSGLEAFPCWDSCTDMFDWGAIECCLNWL